MAAQATRLGSSAVHRIPSMMHSEDFGLLAESINVPAVYWFINAHQPARPNGNLVQNHSPQFAPALTPALSVATEAVLGSVLSKLGTEPTDLTGTDPVPEDQDIHTASGIGEPV
ncbi:hypothetical protein ACFXON_24255 [Bacillus subtilis]